MPLRREDRSWRQAVDRAGATLERWLTPVWNGLNWLLERIGVRSPRTRRYTLSTALSVLLNVLVLLYLGQMIAPTYRLPEPPVVDVPVPVDIMEMPRPPEPEPPPPVVPPKPVVANEPIPQVPTPPTPQPTPPQPAAPTQTPSPPKPEPPKPAPPQPAPPKPSFLPAQVQQTVEKPRNVQIKLAPSATQNARLQTAPNVTLNNEEPTTNPGPPKPSPDAPLNASQLNIHSPAQSAPAFVPASPFKATGGPAGRPGSAPAGGSPAAGAPGANTPGGATGSGRLNPYPYGAMPSGGGGLRGTLVGCANADAVKLTGTERNRCNERFGAGAAAAPVLDGIAPSKRSAFDRAAEQNEASRKYRDSVPNGNPPPNGPERAGGLGTVPVVKP